MNSQDLMQRGRSSGLDAGSWLEIDAAAFESNVRNLLSMTGRSCAQWSSPTPTDTELIFYSLPLFV